MNVKVTIGSTSGETKSSASAYAKSMKNLRSQVTIEATSNPTVSAFFKAYSKVSPHLKKAKTKEQMQLVEEATEALTSLLKALDGKKKKGK